MHPFFQITSENIKTLNDGQARELIARLCKAELQVKGIGTDAVTWGGDQRAKDGGVDVRVEAARGAAISGYIPKDSTVYQVKAEPFGKPKIPGEMEPKGIIRSALIDLAAKSGAYVIVSTRDDLSDLSLLERKQAMTDCIKAHGLDGRVYLDFYDSRKIADWVENHPAIVVWVKTVLGDSLEGWRAYGPWAYNETSVDSEYLLDDRVIIRAPSEEKGITVLDAIDRVRGDLSNSKSSVRIVGLSGVGKTRFVQALFDNRINTEHHSLDQGNVLYTDLSNNPTPSPVAILETLVLKGSESVVVVDNCGQDAHQKLTEVVKRPGSKIRLVTVEYDIRDHLPEGTVCYHLEGASREVVAQLLKRRYQILSDLDVDKIVELSDGNARVAFALASTAETRGELALLRDDALFERLFIQKHSENNELLRCAEAASLLYSFDFEDTGEDSELAVLSVLADVTISTFYRNVSELQGRGLVQERGKWRALLPHAIANRLAFKAVQSIPEQVLTRKFVTGASKRVRRSFSRRLGYLHESKQAQQIVEGWLQPEGLLGNITELDNFGWEMLENISPINQCAALSVISRAIESFGTEAVKRLGHEHPARLLRSLAYEPDLFDEAALALLKLALAQTDKHRSRNALISLFYIYLSGTLASPEQRAAFVQRLATSDECAKQDIAIDILEATFAIHHVATNYDFDFGALKRGYGWHPQTFEEIQGWSSRFIKIACDLGKARTAQGIRARTIVAEAFRRLWTEAVIEDDLTRVACELAQVDGWPEGWISVLETLKWDSNNIAPVSLKKLKALESDLKPRDLQTKIRAKVLGRRMGCSGLNEIDADSEVDRFKRARVEARSLGQAAAQDIGALADLTPFISPENTTDMVWYFAVGVGKASDCTRHIFDRLKPLVLNLKAGRADFQFITGLVTGWNEEKPEEVTIFLDEAVGDEVWGGLYPILQFAIDLDQVGYLRLMKSLELGKASGWAYMNLGCGCRTDPLTVTEISALLDLLAANPDGGLPTAIDVLGMVIFSANSKGEQYIEALRACCLDFVHKLEWQLINLEDGNVLFRLEEIFGFSVGGSASRDLAIKVLIQLIDHATESRRFYPHSLGKLLLPYFNSYPNETLDTVYSRVEHAALKRLLRYGITQDEETVIGSVPESILIKWCQVSPEDRYGFAAQTCKLFDAPSPDDHSEHDIIRISSTAIAVLAHAIDKNKILDILTGRFYPRHWSGSYAAILRQRFEHLDELNPTNNPELTLLITELKVRVSRSIENEEMREQERKRLATGSFE